MVEDAARHAVASGAAAGMSVGQYIGEFYSNFFAVVNVAGLVIQPFLVSRVVKYLGIRVAISVWIGREYTRLVRSGQPPV